MKYYKGDVEILAVFDCNGVVGFDKMSAMVTIERAGLLPNIISINGNMLNWDFNKKKNPSRVNLEIKDNFVSGAFPG